MQGIYRLTKARHADTALSGEGSLRYDGRWHRRGIRIVSASDAPASTLLGVIAHTQACGRPQHDHVLFEGRLDPDELQIQEPEPFEIDSRRA